MKKINIRKKENLKLDCSASCQRQILLSHLKSEGRITVTEGRGLGIMSVPARVLELRRRGYDIVTHWITEHDRFGICHKNGLYVYRGLKKEVKNA